MKSTAIAFLLGGNPLWGAASGLSLLGKWKRRRIERAALRRLRALDDHLLADMGLSRDEVGIRIVREGHPD
jgi:uncharacterized protein YjiS (DUF1127 family)